MFEHFMTLTRPDFLASFLGLLKKMPQTGWLKKLGNLLAHNSGGQKSEIKLSGPCSLKGITLCLFLAFGSG